MEGHHGRIAADTTGVLTVSFSPYAMDPQFAALVPPKIGRSGCTDCAEIDMRTEHPLVTMEDETTIPDPGDDSTPWISDVVHSIASLPEVRDRVITDEDIDRIARFLHRAPSYVRRAPRADLLFLIYNIEQADARTRKT